MSTFINSTETLVKQIVENCLMCFNLKEIPTSGGGRILLRDDWNPDDGKVAILSGGGSGHEPAHVGFIGPGMLTGTVQGELFASPSVSAIEAAIEAVNPKAGCILVVKNYTGDRLNFGLAAERAKAKGYKVEIVLVGDDVALPGVSQPRGLAGTVLIHKICGHYSEQGKPLEEIVDLARKAASELRTIGLSLGLAHVPGKTREKTQPALGLGIHNEPGARKIEVNGAEDAVSQALAAMLPEDVSKRSDQYVLLVNDLGGCSPQERQLICRAALLQLGLNHIAGLIGPKVLMSALDMHGFSLTLLPAHDEYMEALKAPSAAPAWSPMHPVHKPRREAQTVDKPEAPTTNVSHNEKIEKAIRAVAKVLLDSADELDDLDAFSGDGDAGSTFAGAGRGLNKALDKGNLPTADATAFCHRMAQVVEHSMGGSSGILLSLLFTGAEHGLAKGESLAKGLATGIEKMQHYGGAKAGDRTMLDALIPAIDALAEGGSLADAAKAARKGADATAQMLAKAGRAALVPKEDQLGHSDPGAEAIARVFETLAANV